MSKILMKGCEAIGEAAIRAGCRAYFCYPITPQSEVAEYLSKRMPEVGGVFLQGESEVAVSYMIFGAAGAGARVFTTSSSPGISLMSEGLSYIAGAELPAVFINIIRCGPGLGGILPAQSDYFQATKGGGHGDYRLLVLAPSTIQEAADLTMLAFELADKYRNPVMLLGDGMIGQMMEPVEFREEISVQSLPVKEWATVGAKRRKRNLIKTLYLDPEELYRLNLKLGEKYSSMKQEIRYEEYNLTENQDILVVAYGTMARICKTAIDELGDDEGIRAGLLRPVTLFPFPEQRIREAAGCVRAVLVVEMSMGQMFEDVERSIQGRIPLKFYGKTGGLVPAPEEVKEKIKELSKDFLK